MSQTKSKSVIAELKENLSYLKLVRPRQVITLIGFTLSATFFESISIAMLLPILEYIENDRNIVALANTSDMWAALVRYHGYLGIPVTLITLMLGVLGLVLVRQVFEFCNRVYAIKMNEEAMGKIRKQGFRRFLNADLSFFSDNSTGAMIGALTLEAIRASSTVMGIVQTFGYAMLFISYFVILMLINLPITLLTVGIMTLNGIAITALLRKSRAYGKMISQSNKRFGQAIVEKLAAVRLIKLSAREDDETERQSEIVNGLAAKSVKIAEIESIINATIQVLVLIGALAIIYLSTEVYHLSFAKISIFVFILLRMLPLAQHLFKYAQSTLTNTHSLESVKDMIQKAESASRIRGGTVRFEGVNREIAFRDVSFRYEEGSALVLKSVSFTIPSNKMTALVGRSGAGKSTIADLLPRLIVPESGEILVDGRPIADFDLASLRTRIAFVSQEGFLFDGTLLENIRYSRPDATLEEVEWACRSAYIADFIRTLPQGYDTPVGERGVKLSGGQKQRINLARALLQKAPVIVLDEPTSALDSESEIFIQKAIEDIRASQNTTLIIIAHRLSTIRSADQILVVDQGRIVESGAHQELVSSDEWYSDMFRHQAGGGLR